MFELLVVYTTMQETISDHALLETAKKAALAAAERLLYHRLYGFEMKEKTSTFDRVTSADIESERIITKTIYEAFPDHNIFAEEDSYTVTDSPYTWVIDPIDGTNNFIKGLPYYSISIAVRYENRTRIGVVYDPSKKELFSAILGQGAFLDNEPIRVTSADTLKDAMLITGFYYNRGEAMVECLETIRNFFSEGILGIRRLGSAALDLCYLASGRADAYWEYRLSPWDFAAGVLICEEAGGKVTTRDAGHPELEPAFIIASNSRLHDDVIRVIELPKHWK